MTISLLSFLRGAGYKSLYKINSSIESEFYITNINVTAVMFVLVFTVVAYVC